MVQRHSTDQKPFRINDEDLSSLLTRITASPQFQRSKRLQAFLRYVCEQAAHNHSEEISEFYIGQRVFDRGIEFNPAEDNIVRVEARELRKRLEHYFNQEGSDEPVLIEIPRGSYIPVFTPRPQECLDPPESPSPPQRLLDQPAQQVIELRRWGLTWMVLCALLMCLCGWLWLRLQRAELIGRPPESVRLFWNRILSPDRPTVVAVADSTFALLQDLRRETVSFEDYVNGSFFSSLRAHTANDAQRYQSAIAARAHTSLADVMIFSRINGLAPPGATVSLRFAREVRVQDLQASNIVFIGSERSNPWSSLFRSRRNFEFQYVPETGLARLINKRPRAGEPPEFTASPLGSTTAESYAAIAYLPSLDRSGHVVILAGASMQGTAAAGDFLTRPDKIEQLAQRLGVAPGRPLPYFEGVLKLVAVETSSVSAQIVAHRVLDPSKIEPIRYTQP